MRDLVKKALPKPSKVQRRVNPDPSRGGARGYDVHFRDYQLEQHANGEEVKASLRSIQRWKKRIIPHEMTGNVRENAIPGRYILEVALYRAIWPKATADEVRAHVFRTVEPAKVLSRRQVYTIESEHLGLTRKRGSTTAFNALLPINLNKRRLFWTTPYPTGLFQVPRSQIIDVDECALYIQTANRSYGKAPSGVRVREPGPFKEYEKLPKYLGRHHSSTH